MQESTDAKAGLKNINMTECTQEVGFLQSLNTCRKVSSQVNFLDDDILHGLLGVFSFYGSRISLFFLAIQLAELIDLYQIQISCLCSSRQRISWGAWQKKLSRGEFFVSV
jgi:hypothetical protein